MRWRKQTRQATSPNFLFSTWPQVEWGQVPRVLVEPSGEDDSIRFQAAANRLYAIGGGTMRLSAGDYYSDAFPPFYLDPDTYIEG